MTDHLTSAEQYRERAANSVASAEAATSNEIRSHHYAIANHYLLLAEAEMKAAGREAEHARAGAAE
jgi:hypothetical protein